MKYFLLPLIGMFCWTLTAQNLQMQMQHSETMRDPYKFSRIIRIADDDQGGLVIVRVYFGGMILKQQGYFIEHYNQKQELVSNFEYKTQTEDIVGVTIAKGKLHFIGLEYVKKLKSYQFYALSADLDRYRFQKSKLASVGIKSVRNPLGRSVFERNFNANFSSILLFNEDHSAFAIDINYRKKKENFHRTLVFNAALEKQIDWIEKSEKPKHFYGFENMMYDASSQSAYMVAKGFFTDKKRSKKARNYQYMLVKVSKDTLVEQPLVESGKYLEALKPVKIGEALKCVGMYSEQRGNRQNGLCYFEIAPKNLTIKSSKYQEFSEQFMLDKFGRTEGGKVKNLVFKGLHITDDGGMIFNAEEYFVTENYQSDHSGSGRMVDRHHFNDIVCVKLDANGQLEWARNINKKEVRQGDEAYASYTSYYRKGSTYFFINASEQPQKMSKKRLLFKESYTATPNLFAIKIDQNGTMNYTKVLDDKEIRVPIMVSKALVQKDYDQVQFLAKRGTTKLLLKAVF